MSKLHVFGNNNIYREGTDKIISLNEKKTKYIASNNNNKSYSVYTVDGGLVPSNNKCKCDFLLIVQENINRHTGYFIELKGKDHCHALEQLISSIDSLGEPILRYYKTNQIEYIYNCRVSTTAGVSHKNPNKKYILLKKNLKSKLKPYKGELDIKNTPYIENV
jgi:hypothetical protein